MRRLAIIGVAVVALGVAMIASTAEGDGGPTDDYQIRAFFDNAGFLVKDEEVRIGGATVGTVESVDVTMPGEPVTENGDDYPGKAVAVLNITDPGFQDFRTDATCIIRPQSLLGEKFVECKPTLARSSLTEPPPELEVIGEGEVGEGQRYLPLENNGKAVDIDLVNNIYREPEVDKFRLILNDFGAGLAARGDTLGEVIERANPALKQTDRVLAILAEQNQQLAQLQVDSDAVLTPLARERERIAGFIKNATIAGQASAERKADIEQGFVEFPNALRELELTMVQLRKFSEAATPVAADLRVGAPSLTGMTEALGPFADAGTSALTTLGDAAEASGPDLVASKGLIEDLGTLGTANEGGAKALNKLLSTLRRSGGRDQLFKAVLGVSNAVNGYDSYGHFLRGVIQINNCADMASTPVTGCGAKWTGATSSLAQTLTGEAAINANPTADQIIPSPISDQLQAEADVQAEDDNAGKLGQRQRDAAAGVLGQRQSRAAQDLLGFLTEDSR